MPAPVSLIPSAALSSPTPTPAPLCANGMGILGLGGGLFGHILNLDSIVPALSDGQLNQSNLPLAGNNGFSLSPAMLVLPQELSSLSDEDLQSLLVQFANSQDDGGINNQILQSLTPGTPAKEILPNLIVKKDGPTVLPLNPDTENVFSPVNTDNVLLVASGLSPSTIEDFKNAIQTVADDAALNKEMVKDSLGENATDSTAAMIMVMFLSSKPVLVTPEASNFEFDPSTFSSLTKTIQPLSYKTSIFDGEIGLDGETNPLLTLDKLQVTNGGFQGSLVSINGGLHGGGDADKAVKSLLGDVSGQLSVPSASQTSILGAPLSHFSEASLLMANGNLIGSQNLSPNTNPLFTSATATGSHPATYMIAMMIEKATSGSDKAKQELSVQLDPPELGRVQIHLSMEKGEAMKVRLSAEKQETLTLLQRDSYALKSALDSAGIQTDGSSLSFDLSGGNQSFNQLLGGSQQDNQSGRNTHFALNADGSVLHEDQMKFIDTKMDFIPNHVTGNVHYSLLV